jgi:hypothetical protein
MVRAGDLEGAARRDGRWQRSPLMPPHDHGGMARYWVIVLGWDQGRGARCWGECRASWRGTRGPRCLPSPGPLFASRPLVPEQAHGSAMVMTRSLGGKPRRRKAERTWCSGASDHRGARASCHVPGEGARDRNDRPHRPARREGSAVTRWSCDPHGGPERSLTHRVFLPWPIHQGVGLWQAAERINRVREGPWVGRGARRPEPSPPPCHVPTRGPPAPPHWEERFLRGGGVGRSMERRTSRGNPLDRSGQRRP